MRTLLRYAVAVGVLCLGSLHLELRAQPVGPTPLRAREAYAIYNVLLQDFAGHEKTINWSFYASKWRYLRKWTEKDTARSSCLRQESARMVTSQACIWPSRLPAKAAKYARRTTGGLLTRGRYAPGFLDPLSR